MIMKQHLLAAMREIHDQWEALLAQMDEAQISAPLAPSHWSTKDVLTHLWAWQQRSVARMEAVQQSREPVFPQWVAGDPDADADKANAAIYDTHHARPWPEIHAMWQAGFQRLLDVTDTVSERDLLDTSRYAWLHGQAPAFILIASYDHHQEHLEKMQTWLRDHAPTNT